MGRHRNRNSQALPRPASWTIREIWDRGQTDLISPCAKRPRAQSGGEIEQIAARGHKPGPGLGGVGMWNVECVGRGRSGWLRGLPLHDENLRVDEIALSSVHAPRSI